MKPANFNKEEFLPFDDTLLNDLKNIEGRIRQQMTTPLFHYPVAELINHRGTNFFKLWNEQEFKPYDKKSNKRYIQEYRGIYAFASERDGELKYEYVGISRGIRQRFDWHVSGTIINHATWAWLMVEEKEKWKAEKRKNPEAYGSLIKELLKTKQTEVIHRCRFTFFPIDNDMKMHIAEVYCANHLQAYWNTFRTH